MLIQLQLTTVHCTLYTFWGILLEFAAQFGGNLIFIGNGLNKVENRGGFEIHFFWKRKCGNKSWKNSKVHNLGKWGADNMWSI